MTVWADRLPSRHLRVWSLATGMVAILALSACGASGGGSAQAGTTAGAVAETQAVNTVTLASLESKVDLSQCGKATRTIKTDLGTTTITGTPRRVVTLEMSFIDAMAEVGVTPVGIADDNKKSKVTGLMDGITQYTSVGLRSSPNLTVISSLKPDLIVADTSRDKAIYGQLSQIAPTISLTSLGAGYTDTLATDLVVAEAANQCTAMEKAISAHLAAMKKIAAGMPKLDNRTAMYADTEPPSFEAHSANQWEPQIMASVGLRSVLPPKPGSRAISLTLEQLFSYNPQVMFLGSNGQQGIVQQWQSSPVWGQISAVQNKAVFTVPDELWSQERGMKDAQLVLQQVITDLRGKGQ